MNKKNNRISIKFAFAVVISFAASACNDPDVGAGVRWADVCSEASGKVLYNGVIHTMDADNSVVSSVRLQNNLVAGLSNGDEETLGVDGDCRIDLSGRTAIPGLIDNHSHVIGRGLKPGHMVYAMDSARSWDEAVVLLQKQITVENIPLPEAGTVGTQNNFVTVIGAITPGQFVEGALPSFETLNQFDHPIYLESTFTGGTQTNSTGIDYFRAHGLPVSDDGVVDIGSGTNNRAFFNSIAAQQLRSEQTEEDRVDGVLGVQAWAASLGMTMSLSDGGTEVQRIADNGAVMRVRGLYGGASLEALENEITTLNDTSRDAMYRNYAIGEFIDGGGVRFPTAVEDVVNEETYIPKINLAASLGATVFQHTLSPLESDGYLTAFESSSEDLTALRWHLAHVPLLTTTSMDRLEALGGGAVAAYFSYSSEGPIAPPPFKALFEHDVHSGLGSDGGNVAIINPWLGIYHVTTGLDDTGTVVFEDVLTVEEAIRWMTINNAWFSFDEENLGSIEEGKLADVAVLSDDVFGMEDLGNLRDVKSVLTIMDGKIVYSDNSVITCANADTYGEWFPRSSEEVCQ